MFVQNVVTRAVMEKDWALGKQGEGHVSQPGESETTWREGG